MLSKLTLLISITGLAACGSDAAKQVDAALTDGHKPVDAVVHHDAATPDAKVFLDAPVPSSVTVVANCTGVAAGDIAVDITTNVNDTFSPTTATIAAGKYVRFTTSGPHNFENRPGAPANSVFVSGPAGPQTSCLQFTVAGTFPWQCVIHGSMGMVGTLTVN